MLLSLFKLKYMYINICFQKLYSRSVWEQNHGIFCHAAETEPFLTGTTETALRERRKKKRAI